MRIVIPYSEDRISPLFDVSKNLLLLDVEAGAELERIEVRLENADLVGRAKRIAGLGAQVVICGAISKPFQSLLTSLGVWVIPNTCGPIEEVVRAFLTGNLTEKAFLMPGADGQRRRVRPTHADNGPEQ